MDVAALPGRSELKAGLQVEIEKANQGTGWLTTGTIKEILTVSGSHPHGIKVRLQDEQVGRVKKITGVSPQESKHSFEYLGVHIDSGQQFCVRGPAPRTERLVDLQAQIRHIKSRFTHRSRPAGNEHRTHQH